jgi:hypothetical protein
MKLVGNVAVGPQLFQAEAETNFRGRFGDSRQPREEPHPYCFPDATAEEEEGEEPTSRQSELPAAGGSSWRKPKLAIFLHVPCRLQFGLHRHSASRPRRGRRSPPGEDVGVQNEEDNDASRVPPGRENFGTSAFRRISPPPLRSARIFFFFCKNRSLANPGIGRLREKVQKTSRLRARCTLSGGKKYVPSALLQNAGTDLINRRFGRKMQEKIFYGVSEQIFKKSNFGQNSFVDFRTKLLPD